MSTEEKLAELYGGTGLLDRILKALREIGLPTERMSPEDLFPFDQMHGRQLTATREHTARLQLDPSQHVLDVGSGIGGPARYMAHTFGCRVTGIDLTQSFVAAAEGLTARCGLSEHAGFRLGNALAMPFTDAAFDAASCQYVAMNIADKAGLLREIGRVLKPAGRLMWSSIVSAEGEPRYPLPWARDPSVSFLVSMDTLRRLFDTGGWRILEWTDETPLFLGSAAPALSAPAKRLRMVISGEDFPERSKNLTQNIEAGTLKSVLVVAERP